MISEETYNAVQAISRARARVPIYSKKKTLYSFHRIVLCEVCNGPKSICAGKNRSAKGIYSLTYHYDNKEIQQKAKENTSQIHLCNTLDPLKLIEKEHVKYGNAIDKHTDENIVDIRTKKCSLEGKTNHVQSKSRVLSEIIPDMTKSARTTLINNLECLKSVRIDAHKTILINQPKRQQILHK